MSPATFGITTLICSVCSLVAWLMFIWIVIIAFKDGVKQGVLSLICGFYTLYYMIVNFRKCAIPATVYFVVVCIYICGIVLIGQNAATPEGRELIRKLDADRDGQTSYGEIFALMSDGSNAKPAQRSVPTTNTKHSPERKPTPKATLLGTWRNVAGVDKELFTFAETEVTIDDGNQTQHYQATYSKAGGKLRVTLKNEEAKITLKGIYRVKGDSADVLLAHPGQPRPYNFAERNRRALRLVLERVDDVPHDKSDNVASEDAESPQA